MQKKFVVNLILLLFLNLLIKPFWIFGIDRVVQNSVIPEDYGVYFALFNFSMLFNMLLDGGITSYNSRNIAQHQQLLSKNFPTIVGFKGVLAIVYLLVTFFVAYSFGYDSSRFQILFFLTINQFLISFIQYLRSNIAGLQLFTLDSCFSVLDKLIMVVLGTFLVFGTAFPITILNFVYIQTIAYSITMVVILFVVLSKIGRFVFRIKMPFFLLVLKQTFPYALLVLLMTFYYRIDAVMLDFMLENGEYEASSYAQAYRLMDAANQMGVLFAGLLLPMFARMIKKKDSVETLVRLSFTMIFVPAVVFGIITFFFSSEIMANLYSTVMGGASSVLQILMCCFIAISTTYIFGTLLTANGSLRVLNRLAISGLLLNIVLNWILIPKYQAVGSSIASLATQVLIAMVQILWVTHIFKWSVNYILLIRLIAYTLLVVLIAAIVKHYFSGLSLQLVMILSASFLIAAMLKLIEARKMYRLVTSKQ